MSEENVEIVRECLEAYAAGDMEEMLSYVDPEGELHSAIIGGAEGKVFRGHDGFRRWYAESMESFEELRTELTESAIWVIASSPSATSCPWSRERPGSSTRPRLGIHRPTRQGRES